MKRKSPKLRRRKVETLADYFTALAGPGWEHVSFLEWPPDVFCLLASLLQRSGGYIRLVKSWPPPGFDGRRKPTTTYWCKEMVRRGKSWWRHVFLKKRREVLGAGRPHKVDEKIRAAWLVIAQNRNESIASLVSQRSGTQHADFWLAVFETLSAADEACWGIGTAQQSKYKKDEYEGEPDWFLFFANLTLGNVDENQSDQTSSTSATLCSRIPAFLGSVLPKMHTPQRGLTLRSITHNLAYIRPSEVSVSFKSSMSHAGFFNENDGEPRHSLNVLFVPWPSEVKPLDFLPVECRHQSAADGFKFFTFAPKRPSLEDRGRALSEILEEAKDLVGKIDGVLLPELALAQGEQENLAKQIWNSSSHAFLVAGVGAQSKSGDFGANTAVFVPSKLTSVEQAKHHRWQLDGSQIDQYGLGANLDPNHKWWEHIPIENRQINFCNVSERVTLTLLICEDLARQDPIADIIRSVGPNLVIALLMDGPQLSGRWPSHYATVLADDPGSSVLTVTSIGMSHLCRPKGKAVSRIVGLWKDHIQGFREIELPVGAAALVLTLTLVDKAEWTADGRSDGGQSTYLTLNGIHPVFTKKTPH